jgi:hypothetical protein
MADPTEEVNMRLNNMDQLVLQLFAKLDDISTRLERQSQQPLSTPEFTPRATTAPTPSSEPTPVTAKPHLPHPPMFGGNKSQWRGWKLEMEGKIEADAQAIGDPRTQLRYIYARLEGTAKVNVTTYYELAIKQESPNPHELLNRLDLLYGERNRKQKAIQNLHSIRQKEDETFITFYPRFEKEIANANAEGWDDDAKISYLRNALNSKMKDKLVDSSGSDDYTYMEFVQKCASLSNNMELYGQWTKKGVATGNARAHAPTATAGSKAVTQVGREDMMEWEPTPPIPTQVNAIRFRNKDNGNGRPSKRPEDQELLGKRAKWVGQEEIDARRREGRCLRCGRSQCRIATCPLAAAIRPAYTSVKVASSAAVTSATVEDELEEADEEQ